VAAPVSAKAASCGATVARNEGRELNLLGLGFGIDNRALRLPGFGQPPSEHPDQSQSKIRS
jgi:hypothetical protein